jgi:uncharacterized protein (TIGR03000 family)
MFMSRRRTLFALSAVACALLLLPDVSSAQLFGRGGRMYGGGWGNYGNWGGYSGYGGYYNPGYMGTYGWSQPMYGSPYYGTLGGNTYVSPGFYASQQPYNYSSPIFNGTVYPNNMASSTQSLYPPDGRTMQGGMTDNTRAYIDVHVPPNAQVLFDNSPTQQRGQERRFVTPPLDPNSHYTYNVTAKWMENGQERRENKTVRLTPGQTSEVNFLTNQGQGRDGERQQPRDQQFQRDQQQPQRDQQQQQPPRQQQPPPKTTPPPPDR